MAVTLKGTLGQAQSKTAGTTLAITGSITVAVGDDIFIAYAGDLGGGVTSYSKTGTAALGTLSIESTLGGGGNISQLIRIPVTAAGTVTGITLTHGSVTARAAVAGHYGGVGSRLGDHTYARAGSASILSPDYIGGTPTTFTIPSGSLVVAAHGYEGVSGDFISLNCAGMSPNTPTTVGSVATSGGGAASNISVRGYHLLTDADGTNERLYTAIGARNNVGVSAWYEPAAVGPTHSVSLVDTAAVADDSTGLVVGKGVLDTATLADSATSEAVYQRTVSDDVSRKNLFTNPVFATVLAPVGAAGTPTTLAQTASLPGTPPLGITTGFELAIDDNDDAQWSYYSLVVGERYVWSIYSYIPAASGAVLGLEGPYKTGYASQSNISFIKQYAAARDTWERLAVEFTANDTTLYLRIGGTNSVANGYFTGWMLEKAPALGDFFYPGHNDGSVWDGATNNSVSAFGFRDDITAQVGKEVLTADTATVADSSTAERGIRQSVGASNYSDTVLATSNLANYLRLGETTGTVADDATANNRDGTIGANVVKGTAGLLTGDPNTAMTFPDLTVSSDRLYLASDAVFQGASGFAVEFWVKINTLPAASATNTIVTKGSTNWECSIYDVAGRLAFITGGHTPNLLASGSTYPTVVGRTYHVVMQWNTTLGKQIWRDGVKIAEDLTATAAVGVNTTGASIAGSEGVVDEFAFYTAPLSDATIIAHYNAGTTVSDTVGLTDTQTTEGGKGASLADTATVADAASTNAAFSHTVAEVALTTSDATTQEIYKSASLVDSTTVADSTAMESGKATSVADVVLVSPSVVGQNVGGVKLGADLVAWDAAQTFTVDFDFQVSNTNTIGAILMGQTEGSTRLIGANVASYVPAAYFGTDRILRCSFFWHGNTGDVNAQVGTAGLYDDGQPHHLTGTYDGTVQRTYIDGTLIKSWTTGQTAYGSGTGYSYFAGAARWQSWTAIGAQDGNGWGYLAAGNGVANFQFRTGVQTAGITPGTDLISTSVGKAQTDTATVADTTTASAGFAKTQADTTTLADSTATESAKGANLADTTTLADSSSPASGHARLPTDTATVADAASTAAAYSRSQDDTATVADARISDVGKPLSIAQGKTISLVKQCRTKLSAIRTTIASLTRSRIATLSATQTAVASVIKSRIMSLPVAQATATSASKLLGRTLTAARAATATVPKLISRTSSTSLAATATQIISAVVNVTLTASRATAATMQRLPTKTLSITKATSASVFRALVRSYSIIQPAVATVQKSRTFILAAAQGNAASLQPLLNRLLATVATTATSAQRRLSTTKAAAQGKVATVVRSAAKSLRPTQANAAVLGRTLLRVFSIATITTATMRFQRNATLTITQSVVATRAVGLVRTLVATAGANSTVTRIIGLPKTATQAVAASWAAAFTKTLSAASAAAASTSKLVAQSYTATLATSAEITKLLERTLTAAQAVVATYGSVYSRTLTAVAVNTTALFARTIEIALWASTVVQAYVTNQLRMRLDAVVTAISTLVRDATNITSDFVFFIKRTVKKFWFGSELVEEERLTTTQFDAAIYPELVVPVPDVKPKIEVVEDYQPLLVLQEENSLVVPVPDITPVFSTTITHMTLRKVDDDNYEITIDEEVAVIGP